MLLIHFLLFSYIWGLPQLTPDNFDAYLKDKEVTLILARVDNCSKCDILDQTFLYIESKSSIKIHSASINTEEHPHFLKSLMHVWRLADRKPTPDVPIILLSRFGFTDLYQGPKDLEGMIKFLNQRKKMTILSTSEKKREFMGSLELPVAVGYFQDNSQWAEFEKASWIFGNRVKFGIVTKKSIAKSLGLKKVGQFVLQVPFEKKQVYKSGKGLEKIVKFLNKYTQEAPLMAIRTSNVFSILKSSVNIFIALVGSYEGPTTSRFLKNVHDVAQDHIDKKPTTIFVYTKGEILMDYLLAQGLPIGSTWPVFFVMCPLEGKSYFLDKESLDLLQKDDVQNFVDDYFAKRLANQFRSEEEPADNLVRLNKYLTGKSFDKYVRELGKSAFVLFHNPGCSQCTTLMALWEELALNLVGNENLRFGHIDIDANTVLFSIPEVPKLFYFPNCVEDDIIYKTYVEYEGDFEMESILEFLDLERKKCEEIRQKEVDDEL